MKTETVCSTMLSSEEVEGQCTWQVLRRQLADLPAALAVPA